MHEHTLQAAAYVPAQHPALSAFRLVDTSGVGWQLLADVRRATEVVGHIVISEDGGECIAGYTLLGYETGEPLGDYVGTANSFNLTKHKTATNIANIIRHLVDRVLGATEHKITLVDYFPGIGDDSESWQFTINGVEGAFTAYAYGETLDHQGMPTTPTYPDGTSAGDDVMNLLAKFKQHYEEQWELHQVGQLLTSVKLKTLTSVQRVP